MSFKIGTLKDTSLEIDALFFAAIIVVLLTGYLREFVLCFICMAMHEAGHVITAILANARVLYARIMPVGLNAVIDDEFISTSKKTAIYISGPMVNMVLFFTLSIFNSYFLIGSENMRFFILTNLLLAAFNMIPVMPLDGGRLLRNVLSGRLGFIAASKCIYRISLLLSLTLVIAGVVFLFSESGNFSLVCIGLYIFFIMKSGKTEAAFMNVKHVIYRRSRLLKRGIYPARDLVVIKSVHLGEILNNLDFDRFHIIYVLDDDLKICGIFTEQQIIENMLEHNVDMTFGELIEKCAIDKIINGE